MAAAWALTLLAIAGVLVGVWAGQSRLLSAYFAAAGGGLLFGIALFWLLPEVASVSGWLGAVALIAGAAGLLFLFDHAFFHLRDEIGHVAVIPLLIATGVHSFLDGWSVRALAAQNVAAVAAPLGLMLHKLPEGVALGWSARRSLPSRWSGVIACTGVELLTLLGAYSQPQISRAGFAVFGTWWTASVIAVISGSFLFLGFHALFPYRKSAGVLFVFTVTLVLIGLVGLLHSGSF